LTIEPLTHQSWVALRLRCHLIGAHSSNTGVLVLRRTDELRWRHRVRDRRALLHDLGGHEREVGNSGRITVGVRAGHLIVDVVQEQGRRADHGEVFLARLDDGVSRVVCTELRVDEVDDDLPPREAPVGIDELRDPFGPVHRPLEQSRRKRCVDIGDDGEPDLGVRDTDLGRLGLLVP
jgi:hypothetical protein